MFRALYRQIVRFLDWVNRSGSGSSASAGGKGSRGPPPGHRDSLGRRGRRLGDLKGGQLTPRVGTRSPVKIESMPKQRSPYGYAWQKLRLRVLLRDRYRCHVCGGSRCQQRRSLAAALRGRASARRAQLEAANLAARSSPARAGAAPVMATRSDGVDGTASGSTRRDRRQLIGLAGQAAVSSGCGSRVTSRLASA